MAASLLERELKRGSAELLILALLEQRPRHGYEIGRLIEERSDGAINFHVASLYPTLYRLEDKGLIEGRWVERAGQRRRRYYKLTAAGRIGGVRGHRSGSSIRRPAAAAAARLRAGRDPDDGARHRRDDHALQRRVRRAAEAAAVAGRRSPRACHGIAQGPRTADPRDDHQRDVQRLALRPYDD